MLKSLNGLVFSPFIKSKSDGKKLAFLALLTAFNVICNSFLEIKTLDVQFSFTIVVSMASGIILGPLSGGLVCILADFIGYVINSWGYLYMPWVGLSTGVLAFISGLVFKGEYKNWVAKCIFVCFLSLTVCTILINSTGFYFYNKAMGFSTAVLNYVSSRFGKDVGYFTYLIYRLIFKGQIYNSLFNYCLLFLLVPILKRLKVIF